MEGIPDFSEKANKLVTQRKKVVSQKEQSRP